MPVVFGDKNVVFGTKKRQVGLSERQHAAAREFGQ